MLGIKITLLTIGTVVISNGFDPGALLTLIFHISYLSHVGRICTSLSHCVTNSTNLSQKYNVFVTRVTYAFDIYFIGSTNTYLSQCLKYP